MANLQELQEIFSHYLSKGSAAERNFADLKVYNEVVAAADSLNDIEVLYIFSTVYFKSFSGKYIILLEKLNLC